MIPKKIVVWDSFPLTFNGKIDRKRIDENYSIEEMQKHMEGMSVDNNSANELLLMWREALHNSEIQLQDKKSKNPTEQVRKTKDKKDMARMRRSSEQTLEYKIEQAEAKVAKTKEAHEKAVDELKKLYDIRMAYQRDELLKAMKNSSRSYGEILAFITSGETSEDE